MDIQTILTELSQPMHDIPHRVEMCQRALSGLPREGNEKSWAKLQSKLAISLAQNPLGSRTENIEQAIYHYRQALEVYTRQAFPEDWAATQNNLGNAYRSRIAGTKRENLEQVIYHFHQTLEVYTHEPFPGKWATVQNKLGTAYRSRIAGTKRENLEQAIYHFQQALAVHTREAFPEKWAMTQHNLGSSYVDRIAGTKRENLEQAIYHYQQALEVRTREAFPKKWAMTQFSLGNAYYFCITGSKRKNLEQAIYHYQQALEVYTRQSFPEDWAATQNNLGAAYSDRITGTKRENLEQAIYHYQQALEVYTRQAFPEDWAATQNNLGTAYRSRIAGTKRENIEQSIYHQQQALEVRTREVFPEDWAMSHNNLGSAYKDRIAGTKRENLEQAIYHHQQALEVYTREAFPEKWALAQSKLGTAYDNRITGSQSENIEQAIYYHQQALEVRTREVFPEDWAATQNNLGVAYWSRLAGTKRKNIEQAIYHDKQALEVYTREAFPEEWAMAQNNLGTAYRSRLAGTKRKNIEQAIYHYKQALEVCTRQANPMKHHDFLNHLTILYSMEKRWSETYQSALNALAVGNDIFTVAYTDAGRRSSVAKTGRSYLWASYSALQLGNYGDALTHLESGKARLLAEALATGDANLKILDEDERRELQAIREQVQNLEYEFRLPLHNPVRRNEIVISAKLGETRKALRELINALRVKYPVFMPEGVPLNDLLAMIPANAALVAPLFTKQGSAVFIVPAGVNEIVDEHVLMLNNFSLDDLETLSRGSKDNPGWIYYYMDYRFSGTDGSDLFRGIEDITRRIWDAFIEQIHQRLAFLGVQHVLFMPQGDTNLLPLHAAWREVDGQRRYFLDDYVITYIPSMIVLANAKRKVPLGTGALVAGVSHYTNMSNLVNAHIEAESIALLFDTDALLDTDVSLDRIKAGSIDKAYLHLSCHGSFAWGGDTFTSALYLGKGDALSLLEIMANLDLNTVRLVVLSACETGIVDMRNVADEFIGLPAGLMQAGARAVISSLWTVEDRSTALLMERMYKYILDKENPMEPAQALRAAQFWLRDATAQEIGDYYQLYIVPRMSESEAGQAFVEIMMRARPDDKPYAHPFYWAAFTYNGL